MVGPRLRINERNVRMFSAATEIRVENGKNKIGL